MKKTVLLMVLLFPVTLAHEVVKDGDVGALLHIEPDDAPVTGKKLSVWFKTNIKGGTPVTLTNCSCTLSVYQGAFKPGAKALVRPKLKVDAQSRLGAEVTFPTEGAYTLLLSGRPKGEGDFGRFTLSWVVRAEQSGEGHTEHSH